MAAEETAPQAGQMQELPRSAAGIRTSTARSMACGAMHQQLSGARPAAIAQPLGWPHRGQWAVSAGRGTGMVAWEAGAPGEGGGRPVYGEPRRAARAAQAARPNLSASAGAPPGLG